MEEELECQPYESDGVLWTNHSTWSVWLFVHDYGDGPYWAEHARNWLGSDGAAIRFALQLERELYEPVGWDWVDIGIAEGCSTLNPDNVNWLEIAERALGKVALGQGLEFSR